MRYVDRGLKPVAIPLPFGGGGARSSFPGCSKRKRSGFAVSICNFCTDSRDLKLNTHVGWRSGKCGELNGVGEWGSRARITDVVLDAAVTMIGFTRRRVGFSIVTESLALKFFFCSRAIGVKAN